MSQLSEANGREMNGQHPQQTGKKTVSDAISDQEISKYSIRKQIWSDFDKNGLVTFPRPVRGRIPNFIGAGEAAEKLKGTQAFQKAKVIKVNADKPQETVRVHVLECDSKKLILSARRADEHPLLEIKLPEPPIPGTVPSPAVLRAAVTRQGMFTFCRPLSVNSGIKLDMIVVGSVAVSRKGQRIGKCDGYSDLEFGYLCEIGAIDDNTIIATTVHDSQVFDELPTELFQPHDFPVDIIVTPTEVINISPRPPRPTGIIWKLLSKRRMKLSAPVDNLHQVLVLSGASCHLKEEDTDDEVEREIRRKHRPFIHRYARRPIKGKPAEEAAHEQELMRLKPRRSRSLRESENAVTEAEEIKKDNVKLPPRRPIWRRHRIMFSIRVNGIAHTDRVRDLKNALAERNVRPAEIAWFGRRGFAYLHFLKPRKSQESTVPSEPEAVVTCLKDMVLGEGGNKGKPPVIVEPAPFQQKDFKIKTTTPDVARKESEATVNPKGSSPVQVVPQIPDTKESPVVEKLPEKESLFSEKTTTAVLEKSIEKSAQNGYAEVEPPTQNGFSAIKPQDEKIIPTPAQNLHSVEKEVFLITGDEPLKNNSKENNAAAVPVVKEVYPMPAPPKMVPVVPAEAPVQEEKTVLVEVDEQLPIQKLPDAPTAPTPLADPDKTIIPPVA